MNGFKKMREACGERAARVAECRNCNFNYICGKFYEIAPFEWSDEDIEELVELAQDDEPAFGRWIPVSEKEPKEYQCIIVQLGTEPMPTYDIAIYHKEHGYRPWYSEYFQEGTPEWEDGKVVAWMPLPAPYKEEKDE